MARIVRALPESAIHVLVTNQGFIPDMTVRAASGQQVERCSCVPLSARTAGVC
jgi:hypothetical protein